MVPGTRLCKIKIGKDDYERKVVTVKLEVPAKDDFTVHTIECKDLPHPDLENALKAMRQYLCEHAEFPSTWDVQIDVISCTVTHTNDVEGLVITGKRVLQNSNAPLIINTPHYTREPYNEEDNSDIGIFSTSCGEALDVLEREAIAYVDGKRAQLELFNDNDSAQPDLLHADHGEAQ